MTVNKSLKISDHFTFSWEGKVRKGCKMSSGATPQKMNDVYELKILKITLKNCINFFENNYSNVYTYIQCVRIFFLFFLLLDGLTTFL